MILLCFSLIGSYPESVSIEMNTIPGIRNISPSGTKITEHIPQIPALINASQLHAIF